MIATPRRLSPAVRAYLTVALLLLFGMGTFGAGILAERRLLAPRTVALPDGTRVGALGSDVPPEAREQFEDFYRVWRLVEREYYYRPLDRQRMLYGAARGMLATLGDDYTTFLEPVQQQGVREAMSGDYEGIGVWIELPEGRFTIAAPMKDSPAEAAGLRARDVIVRVDGRETTGLAQEEVLKLVRGRAGTVVRLGVQRPGVAEPLEVEVARAVINIPAVTLRMEGDIAVIGISIFGDKTTAQLDAALGDPRVAGAGGIVLDLRNNGGGWVVAAQEMLGRFVEPARGPALLEDRAQGAQARALLLTPTPGSRAAANTPATPGARPAPTIETKAAKRDPIVAPAGGHAFYDLPLVVLINAGTASASEIVVGALQDYGRATTVGTATFGKGSIQSVHEFDDGSSARITVAQWVTPRGRVIQKQGLQPDLVVEEQPGGEDEQLARALAFLRDGR
jgi:carboxyl-terminal processing protease